MKLCEKIGQPAASASGPTYIVDRHIILEAIFAISLTSSPSRWWEGILAALDMCVTNGKNLIINYIDYMVDTYQTVSGGDGRRHGPSHNREMSLHQLLRSLSNMDTICVESSTATSSAQDLLMQSVAKGGLYGVGKLGAGEIGYLLTAFGLFSSPSTTGLSVKIATTTTTGERLAGFGVNSEEQCQELQQCLNQALGTNDSDTENIVCESLRLDSGYVGIDTFHRGQQHLFRLGSGGTLIQVDANGNEEPAPQITFDASSSSSLLRNAHKWWENKWGDNATSIVLTTKKQKRKCNELASGSNSTSQKRTATATGSCNERKDGQYLLYLLRDRSLFYDGWDPNPVADQKKGHPLRNHQKDHVKSAKRRPADTVFFTEIAINVDVSVAGDNNLIIVHQGLHHVTHGGGVLREKGATDTALRDYGVEVIDVPETVIRFSKRRDDDGVNVFRSGTAEASKISMTTTAKRECLHFFLDDRWRNNSSADGGRDQGINVRRFDLLFNQSQGNCDQYCDADGKAIVHPDGKPLRVPLLRSQTEMLKDMPNDVKREFIQVLTGLDSLTSQIYPGAFSDERRRRLVKDYFVNEYFGEHIMMNWEYLGIIVRQVTDNDRLLMHLDLKNDSREHYDYCATYSFVIDGYRVTFVAACKQDFGSLMERLNDVQVEGGQFQQPNK